MRKQTHAFVIIEVVCSLAFDISLSVTKLKRASYLRLVPSSHTNPATQHRLPLNKTKKKKIKALFAYYKSDFPPFLGGGPTQIKERPR